MVAPVLALQLLEIAACSGGAGMQTQLYACSHSQSKPQPNSQWWWNSDGHILFNHHQDIRKHNTSLIKTKLAARSGQCLFQFQLSFYCSAPTVFSGTSVEAVARKKL
jgi:hypothetical protein